MAIADRVAVMSQGEISKAVRQDLNFITDFNSTFVASFVGNAMHLAGKINGAKLTLKCGELLLPSDGTLKRS